MGLGEQPRVSFNMAQIPSGKVPAHDFPKMTGSSQLHSTYESSHSSPHPPFICCCSCFSVESTIYLVIMLAHLFIHFSLNADWGLHYSHLLLLFFLTYGAHIHPVVLLQRFQPLAVVPEIPSRLFGIPPGTPGPIMWDKLNSYSLLTMLVLQNLNIWIFWEPRCLISDTSLIQLQGGITFRMRQLFYD